MGRVASSAVSLAICLFVLGQGGSAWAQDATASGAASAAAIGAESPWPRTVKTGNVTLMVFEPQLDSWDGVRLAGRSAVQVEIGTDHPETRYGVVTFDARTLTDKSRRVVTIDSVRLVKIDFPSSTQVQSKAWTDAIAQAIGGQSRTIALDRLEAAMHIVETQQTADRQPLRNDPPKIVFSTVPAILVYIDGEPRYGRMQGLPFERVLNTRPLLLRDSTGTYYLKVFDGWMSAPDIGGPWTVLHAPSSALGKAFQQASDARSFDPLTGQSTADRPAPRLDSQTPTIVVATAPTELIVTDGSPRPVPVNGAQLLYVANTTGNIFKNMLDNMTYVLIAGRWFRSTTDNGPWQYVPANALPAEFAKIPDDSPKENVKASIAGTSQAREAAIAASVPQTAAVKVAGTQLTPPRFDGEPRFRSIEGTPLTYVANSPTPIIRVSDSGYYAVENGVWFVAASVRGPWAVARSVPAAIYAIPPSSPLYYVTYVRVYEVTSYGRATGEGGGTVAHVGDDVYAGKDGNVYRNTGDGWQKATPSGWEGGQSAGQQLDSERGARDFGEQRSADLRDSSMGMQRSFSGGEFRGGGGFGGGFGGGGFHGGGGFRGRR